MISGNPHHQTTPSGKQRARAFGIRFDGTPGPFNAITDVAGVAVGYSTLISGEGALVVGKGPVRTGVTAILPRPRAELATPVFAGIFGQNGNGELTGSHIIEETGAFNFPITITNTHSCGVSRDATLRWMQRVLPAALDSGWGLPVAAETYDGFLNDINGHHLGFEHVAAALDGATSGSIEEGSVGGGTGMIAFGFKAGSGTASRLVEWHGRRHTVGAFVQANFGRRSNFTIRGLRAGPNLVAPAIRESTPRAERGFNHRDRRHRCAVAAASDEALGTPGAARRRHDRRLRLPQFGRHFSRLHHRQSASSTCTVRTNRKRRLHPGRRYRPVLRCGGAKRGGGDPQCDGHQ
jgi:D-aminopeptidase